MSLTIFCAHDGVEAHDVKNCIMRQQHVFSVTLKNDIERCVCEAVSAVLKLDLLK